MSYFIFNGINSNDLGLIITKPIIRPTWAPEMEYQSIPGRPRQLPMQKTWYPNKELRIEAVLGDASPEKVRDVYGTIKGYGVLNISTAANEFLNCYVDQIDPNGVALLMAEFPISFIVEPFAYSNALYVLDIGNTQQSFSYNGTAFCDPEIVIKPTTTSTTIVCNGKTIVVTTPQEIVDASYLETYSITLDCEGEVAYYTKPDGVNVACTQCTTGPFPRVHAGENVVSCSAVRSANMTIRKRWY